MNTCGAIRHTHDTRRLDAVMFDLDGTLLDTLTDLANAMNRALIDSGFPAHPAESYKYFVGDGVDTEASRALPETARDSETITKVAESSEDYYASCWRENTHPYPGIPELLNALSQHNLILTILSNKPDHFTKQMVAELLPDWRFRIVRGALPDVPIKPDPAAALQIADQIGIPPENFLYLGDTNTDMQTANNAGMFPVGCLWGFRTADELNQNGAKTLIQDPTDIIQVLDNSLQ